MKSKLWKLIALLVTTVLLVSCAGPDSDVGTETEEVVKTEEAVMTEEVVKTEEPPEEVTVRVLTRWSDASPLSQGFRDRLAEFQALNPHITILDESINDEKAYGDKLKTSIATNDLPAIFQNYGGPEILQYVEAGLYYDLTEALNADSEWQSNFLDFWANWQYESVSGTYAVPYEFFGISFFYNADILEEVDASVPTTIAELEAVSEKLLAAGYIPIAMGEKDNFKGDHLFVSLIIQKYGGAMMEGLESGEVRWDGPEVVDILTLMDDWNAKGYLGPNITGVDYASETALFLSGEAAMKFDGSWVLSELEASPIADSIMAAPFPYFADVPEFKGITMGGPGAGLSISGTLTDAETNAAIELLKFVTSVEHFTYLQETTGGGIFPVIMEPGDVGPVTESYINVMNSVTEFDLIGVLLAEVRTQFRDSVQGLLSGSISPEEAAKQIADMHDKVTE